MTYIVLTDEQARILVQTSAVIELRDSNGGVLGRTGPPSEEEIIARITQQRALNLPRYPAEEVESRLRKLQEIRDREGMDQDKMWDLLERMRKGEEV
jgi:hypothetical protein